MGPANEQQLAAADHEPWDELGVTWLSDRRLAVEHGDVVIWELAAIRAATSVWDDIPFAPVVGAVLDSGLYLLGSEHGDVVVVRNGVVVGRFEGHADDVDAPAPAVSASDGRTIAVPGARSVEVRDALSGDVIARGPDGYPRPLALTPDGGRMLVASSRDPVDGRVRFALADTSTGTVVHVVGSVAHAECATVGTDGGVALVAVSDAASSNTVQPTLLWLVDMATGTVTRRGPSQECIVDVAIDADGDRAAAVGCDGTVGLYDLALLAEKGPPQHSVLDRADDIGVAGTGVTFSPDGQTVVVTRADGRVDGFHVGDDVLVRSWSFDVGDHLGAPFAEGETLWLPVRRPIDLPGDVGGLIGVPFDLGELAAFARTLPTRSLTEEECVTYSVRASCPTD
jgi:WD40 repeat protein